MLNMLSKRQEFRSVSSRAIQKIKWFYRTISNVLDKHSIGLFINDFFDHVCMIPNKECILDKPHSRDLKRGCTMLFNMFLDELIDNAHQRWGPSETIDFHTELCNLRILVIDKLTPWCLVQVPTLFNTDSTGISDKWCDSSVQTTPFWNCWIIEIIMWFAYIHLFVFSICFSACTSQCCPYHWDVSTFIYSSWLSLHYWHLHM